MGERQQQFYGNVHTRRERQGALTAGIEPVRQVRGFSLPEILTRALSGWLADTVSTWSSRSSGSGMLSGSDYFSNWLQGTKRTV